MVGIVSNNSYDKVNLVEHLLFAEISFSFLHIFYNILKLPDKYVDYDTQMKTQDNSISFVLAILSLRRRNRRRKLENYEIWNMEKHYPTRQNKQIQ